MTTVIAGFFKITTDEAVSVIEGRCSQYAAHPPTIPTTIEANGQQYILKTPVWNAEHKVLLATMWRVRENKLPSKLDEHGHESPVNADLGEASSFAYRPSHDLALIQSNSAGPRESRAARLLEAAEIFQAASISPDIVPDAIKRMKDAALLKRIEFSLTGVDAAKDAELRQAGLSGALDELAKFKGTSIHISISLGHTPGELDKQARTLLEKLSEVTSGVRTVKASVKETDEHDVELLDLMRCRSKIEFEVEEIGREIDRTRCRERLLFAIVKR